MSRNRATGAEKNELKPHLRQMYVIPPEQSAEFVAHREDVLELYQQPYDPKQERLNIAENELSALTRQCLNRRIPDRQTLEEETTAWYSERNQLQKSVDWQFTTADARIRLKRLYPQT